MGGAHRALPPGGPLRAYDSPRNDSKAATGATRHSCRHNRAWVGSVEIISDGLQPSAGRGRGHEATPPSLPLESIQVLIPTCTYLLFAKSSRYPPPKNPPDGAPGGKAARVDIHRHAFSLKRGPILPPFSPPPAEPISLPVGFFARAPGWGAMALQINRLWRGVAPQSTDPSPVSPHSRAAGSIPPRSDGLEATLQLVTLGPS